jgi:hypothetical protein
MLGNLTSINLVNRIFNVNNTQTFKSIDLKDAPTDLQDLSNLKSLLRENKLLRTNSTCSISLWNPDTLLDIKLALNNLMGLVCIKLGELDNVLIIDIYKNIGSLNKTVDILSVDDYTHFINVNTQVSYHHFCYLFQELIIDSNNILSFFTNTTQEYPKPIKKITIIELS